VSPESNSKMQISSCVLCSSCLFLDAQGDRFTNIAKTRIVKFPCRFHTKSRNLTNHHFLTSQLASLPQTTRGCETRGRLMAHTHHHVLLQVYAYAAEQSAPGRVSREASRPLGDSSSDADNALRAEVRSQPWDLTRVRNNNHNKDNNNNNNTNEYHFT
jgi:hypothetical protein